MKNFWCVSSVTMAEPIKILVHCGTSKHKMVTNSVPDSLEDIKKLLSEKCNAPIRATEYQDTDFDKWVVLSEMQDLPQTTKLQLKVHTHDKENNKDEVSSSLGPFQYKSG